MPVFFFLQQHLKSSVLVAKDVATNFDHTTYDFGVEDFMVRDLRVIDCANYWLLLEQT